MSRELEPVTSVEQSIRLIRGQKVLLDADLAQLYGVSVKTRFEGFSCYALRNV